MKHGDFDYLYTRNADDEGEVRIYKTLGKVLAKDDAALKRYREWKNARKSALAQDVKLVISTNPADIIRKSTSQWWESRSCERLGGGYDKGIWSDIELGNAIAYVTVNGNPSWMGRAMLRWCKPEGRSGPKEKHVMKLTLKETPNGVSVVDQVYSGQYREKMEDYVRNALSLRGDDNIVMGQRPSLDEEYVAPEHWRRLTDVMSMLQTHAHDSKVDAIDDETVQLEMHWAQYPALDFGIEPVFYGDPAVEDAALDKIKEVAMAKGLMDYKTCETPYRYKGWSDQMRGSNKVIIYGEGAKSKQLEEEIDEIVQEWTGVAGYIHEYDPDEVEHEYRYYDNLGEDIRYALDEVLIYADDEGISGLGYGWEEEWLRGYPVRFDVSQANLDKHFWQGMTIEPGDRLSDDEGFVLWQRWFHGSLLKDFIRILRRLDLAYVYYDKPNPDYKMPDLTPNWGGYYNRTEGGGDATLKSGLYDMTLDIPGSCLDDPNCSVLDSIKYTEQQVTEDPISIAHGLKGAPFFYDRDNFYKNYASNIAGFVKCIYYESDIDGDNPDFSKRFTIKDEKATECFEEFLAPIGEGKKEIAHRVHIEDGGLAPAFFKESITEFVKRHKDFDFDELCRKVKERGGSEKLKNFCKIQRPIEKFWEE